MLALDGYKLGLLSILNLILSYRLFIQKSHRSDLFSCFKLLDFYTAQRFVVNRGIPFYSFSPHYWSYKSPRLQSKSLAGIVVDDHVTTHLMRSLSKARVQLYDAAICTFGNFNTFLIWNWLESGVPLIAQIWTAGCSIISGFAIARLDKPSKQAVSVNVFSVSFPLL